MNGKELQKSRARLFRDTANFVKTDRIPHFANVVTWKVFDAGYTLDQAMTHFDVMEKTVTRFLDNYPVDAILDVGIRNQFNVTEAFGTEGYYYYTPEVLGVRDHAHCTPDTLSDYMDDPIRYAWEVILPEKYGDAWAEKDRETWKKTFKEYIRYVFFILHMAGVMKKYGLPSLAPNNPMSGTIIPGMEILMSDLLGIQQLSIAMRRCPEKLDDFIARWEKEKLDPVIEKTLNSEGPQTEKYCFDASILMLAHNIMNKKQFERFYWPKFSELLGAYRDKKMNVRIFAEGTILSYADYFADFPRGALTFHLEQDDPFAFRAALPNAGIMGGMTTDLLSNGTEAECTAYAEKLCTELGGQGGYIFSENKMLSYRNDARRENLLAVCRFVSDYRQ